MRGCGRVFVVRGVAKYCGEGVWQGICSKGCGKVFVVGCGKVFVVGVWQGIVVRGVARYLW